MFCNTAFLGYLRLQGAVCCFAYAEPRATVGELCQALRVDVGRTLVTRLGMMLEQWGRCRGRRNVSEVPEGPDSVVVGQPQAEKIRLSASASFRLTEKFSPSRLHIYLNPCLNTQRTSPQTEPPQGFLHVFSCRWKGSSPSPITSSRAR